MITVLAFLITLGVLIVVHEYGHYRVAVACDVKVLRFSVGFGRPLWTWRRGKDATEFVVCALPLGGYVRMLDEREALVDPREAERAFNRKPLRQRAAIVAAGPLANLALAVLLYAGANWIGLDEPKAILSGPVAGSVAERSGLLSGDEVLATSQEGSAWDDVASFNDLRWAITQAAVHGHALQLQVRAQDREAARVVPVDLSSVTGDDVDAGLLGRLGFGPPFSEAVIGTVVASGPAAVAGLQTGDRVIALDGKPVTDAFVLRERIRASAKGGQAFPLHFSVDRAGRTIELDVKPHVVEDSGRQVARIDAMIGQAPAVVTVRKGPIDGIAAGFSRTWEVSVLTVKMLGRMLVGEASLKNLSGPITIADFAGQSVQQGLPAYLAFLALVSISLGVLNLLPLPMLDGGHLMYYLFEGVTGRPVSELWLKWLQRGGALVLLLLMSLALSNDVARLLGLH